MKTVIVIFGLVYDLIWLVVGVALVVKVWRACDEIKELNRTVQFMAYDIKDLRDARGAAKGNPPGAGEGELPGQQPWE